MFGLKKYADKKYLSDEERSSLQQIESIQVQERIEALDKAYSELIVQSQQVKKIDPIVDKDSQANKGNTVVQLGHSLDKSVAKTVHHDMEIDSAEVENKDRPSTPAP